MKRKHIGSDLDDFLKQDGLLAECEAGALQRATGWQLGDEMKRRKISRAKVGQPHEDEPRRCGPTSFVGDVDAEKL
jgi:hypothetical protein